MKATGSYPYIRAAKVKTGLRLLREAAAMLKGEAPRAYAKVRLAIRSCEGADRNAYGQQTRHWLENRRGA
jgi:hypothetical protein